jgi:hypothetical protein
VNNITTEENNSDLFLEKLYQKLYDNIEKSERKIIENSIILTFFDIKSNDRFRLLQESSIEKNSDFPSENISSMLGKKLIQTTDKPKNYTITAKGIWHIENKKGLMTNEKLIQSIDNKFFKLFRLSEKALTDKEKVILFSMIAARSFSEESSVDLKRDRAALDAWKNITDRSFMLLKNLGITTKLNENELYGKPGNELEVSSLFRHTDALPKKSKGIFTSIGNQKYFLNLSKEFIISEENLSYLFKQIIGDKINPKVIDEIYNFCCEIARNKNIFIFDIKKHKFSKPEYDQIIKNVLYM